MNLYNKLENKLKNKDAGKESFSEKQTEKQTEEDKNVVKCPKCGKVLDKATVIKKKYVCYECGAYFRVRTNNRDRKSTRLNSSH